MAFRRISSSDALFEDLCKKDFLSLICTVLLCKMYKNRIQVNINSHPNILRIVDFIESKSQSNKGKYRVTPTKLLSFKQMFDSLIQKFYNVST